MFSASVYVVVFGGIFFKKTRMENNLVCTACNKNQKNFEVYWWLGYGYICQSCIDNTQNQNSVEKQDLPEEIVEMIQYRAKWGRLIMRDFRDVDISEYRDKALEAIRKYKKAKESKAMDEIYKKQYVDLANKLGIELEK